MNRVYKLVRRFLYNTQSSTSIYKPIIEKSVYNARVWVCYTKQQLKKRRDTHSKRIKLHRIYKGSLSEVKPQQRRWESSR